MKRIIYPIAGFAIGTLIGMAVGSVRGIAISETNWISLLSFLSAGIMLSLFEIGFGVKARGIKITPTSIYGPVNPGRDMPIPFDEIDFEKTRKKKRVYSIHGDALLLDASLFAPDDVAEIWKAIDEFEKKTK